MFCYGEGYQRGDVIKISIITASYNSENTIEQTINSVIKQTYSNIEHLVIDGMSSDGTLEIVKKFDSINVVSEKDAGIYDAMNKGIKRATGDIIGILNSDDLYYDDNVIEAIVEEFRRTGADAVYGDLVYVDKYDTDRIVRYWRSSRYYDGGFVRGWHPAHPAFFTKKEIYEKYGVFDTEFEISADFELMLRFIEKHRITTSYLPRTIVRMRLGGASNRSLANIIKGNANCVKAFKKNGIRLNYLYPLFRLLPKINQYFMGMSLDRKRPSKGP